MRKKKYLIHIFVVVALVAYTWCVESSSGITILSYGPTKTFTGQDFNVQTFGRSAMWFKVRGDIHKSFALKWDDIDLDVTVNPDRGVVSAYIPRRFYAEAGKHTLFLFSTLDGNTSNKVLFEVENKPNGG